MKRLINVIFPCSFFFTNFPYASFYLCRRFLIQIKRRQAEAQKKADAAIASIGKGVTRQAQALFDLLTGTYKCTWDGDSICLPDLQCLIEPPYGGDQCFGKDAAALKRLRKVVTRLNEKIGSAWVCLYHGRRSVNTTFTQLTYSAAAYAQFCYTASFNCFIHQREALYSAEIP